MCELVAVLNPSSAHLQAIVDLWELTLGVVEAVHAAARRLKVHDIELLVHKRIKLNLSEFESLLHTLEHLVTHVFECIATLLVESEEVPELFRRLLFRFKVHFGLFLQLFPGFKFIFTPIPWLCFGLIAEKGRLCLFELLFILLTKFHEFCLSLSLFDHLFLVHVEVAKIDSIVSSLVFNCFQFCLAR
jgi:hypothetical protein